MEIVEFILNVTSEEFNYCYTEFKCQNKYTMCDENSKIHYV